MIKTTLTQIKAVFAEWHRRLQTDAGAFMDDETFHAETPEAYGDACGPYFASVLTEIQEGNDD